MAISGRDEIDALYRGATDGVFTMDEGTAARCAEVVQALIDGLNGQRSAFRYFDYRAFGEFNSARDMAGGFARKADEFGRLLVEYVDAAERLKASFEIAGARVAATEADNATAVLGAENGQR